MSTFYELWDQKGNDYWPDLNDIDKQFILFHEDNPHVYLTLVKEARDLRERGWETFGMKCLYERARWLLTMKTRIPEDMEPYKLNNNYTSRYARLIMQQEPDLKGFFNLRKLKEEQA